VVGCKNSGQEDRRIIATTTATAQITAPTLVEAVYTEEIRQRYLEIRDSAQRQVITTIELLSPFNKMSGERGRVDFFFFFERVMASNVHWIEIDLLRAGARTTEVADKSDYYALLKRGGTLGLFEVWYIDLRDRLPTIAVPLHPPFDDAPLDLQAAFADMYQRAHYAQSIDYTTDLPASALELSDQQWAKQCIAQWRSAQPSP